MQITLGIHQHDERESLGSLDDGIDHGVVYTQPWVVALILDLVGYTEDRDLGVLRALEPSCGTGAFLVEMARRLVASMRAHSRVPSDLHDALVAVELDPVSAGLARDAVVSALQAEGVDSADAGALASSWIRVADFLTDPDVAALAVDIVVGNPPYVRPEAISPDKLAEYRSSYATMRGRADLYVAFYEHSLHLLRADGRLGFICADRWMLNAYGRKLRELVSECTSVDVIIDMHHAAAFAEEVLSYPAITVLRRGKHRGTSVGRIEGEMSVEDARALAGSITRDGTSIDVGWATVEEWYSGDDPWPCGSPSRIGALRGLEERFPTLADEGIRVGIGVATGADKVFITTDKDAAETDRMLPLALGKDTFHGTVEWSGRYLVNPWDADGKLVDLEAFPKLAAYLGEHEEQLRKRHVGKKDAARWYRTIDNVDPTLQARDKLYIPDIKGTLHPVLDSGETYPHHNLYYVVSDRWPMEALGGLLLSDVAQFFVESYSVKMSGGFFRFQAQYLRRIRIPRIEDIDEATLFGLVESFRRRDVAAANEIAHRLYGIEGIPA